MSGKLPSTRFTANVNGRGIALRDLSEEQVMMVELINLRKLRLFDGLNDSDLGEFAYSTQQLVFDANQTICHIGGTGCPIYLVVSGRLRLSLMDYYGKQRIVAHVSSGEIFGDSFFTSPEACSMNVVALTESQLIILNQHNLTWLFRKKPSAALTLVTASEKRLRQSHLLLVKSKPLR